MEYIDVINEETKLKERLKACEEKYALDVLSMTTRLEELSKHKEDFQNGNSSFAFAREYIDVDNPLTILLNFPLYIDSLKKELTKDYKQLLTHNLEIQDNAYGRDWTKYTTLVKKGYGIDYHPNLGSINFSRKMPVQYFSDLIMELEKLLVINESYYNEKGMYRLIGDSYVFHKLDKCSNQWYSVTEAFEKFKQKNWR